MRWLGWIVGVVLLVSSSSAGAYYLETRTDAGDGGAAEPVRYDTMAPITYRLGPMTDEQATAVTAAFEAWNAVDCADISFVAGDPVEAPTREEHWHHWTSDEERYILVHFYDNMDHWSVPQVGLFLFGHDGMGEMIGGTVVLNSTDHQWSTTGEDGALDVQSIVTALIGRSLGITAEGEGNATYPRYLPGDTSKRELGPEDVSALQYVYGDFEVCTPDPPSDFCSGMIGEECPPPVETDHGDAGTQLPGSDGGTSGGTDAGTGSGTDGGGATGDTADAGMDPTGGGSGSGGGDGGCTVGGAARGDGAPLWLLALGLVGLLRRRRV